MNNITIDKIFEMLSWNNDSETQSNGIEIAKSVKHLSVFFQPIENKAVWENCAKVISSKTDEELELYIIPMFEWLQDMNWPGADIILNRLLKMSCNVLQISYDIVLTKAKNNNDAVWISVLEFFKKSHKDIL